MYCLPKDRRKLEQLCRYIARSAVIEEHLRLAHNEDVFLKLKKTYIDGISHLVFWPIEFIEKLAAFVPPQKSASYEISQGVVAEFKVEQLKVTKKLSA